jgi:predicted RNase H-like HicB family nuclease
MLEIHAQWDDEARVWVATSEDVPGLTTEAQTWRELIQHVKEIIPDLMDLNRGIRGQSFAFRLSCQEVSTDEAPALGEFDNEMDATAYLMSSPANAARLMEAINDYRASRSMQERELLPDEDR